MKLTAEDLEKVQNKKVANVLRKLHAGKTLTAREDALLAGATAAPGVDPTGYVGTWDELAARLEVTRRAIQDWRSDPRYAPEIEKRRDRLERADGRKCVAEWIRLMADLRLKRGKAPAEAQDDPENGDGDQEGLIQPPRYGGREADWQKAKVAKDVEKKGIEIETIKGSLLEANELEEPLGATLAAFQVKLTQFPDTAARRVCGLRDEAECREVLRDEIDAILSDLHGARYTAEDAVAEAVADLPFDRESEELFAAVTFDGQDREKLLQLIATVATQALRRLGRGAIAHAQRAATVPDTAISDEVTGQVTDAAVARESRRRSESPGPDFVPVPTQETVEGTGSIPAQSGRESRTGASAKRGSKAKKRKGSRPQPTAPPGEIEGAIHAKARLATRRRR